MLAIDVITSPSGPAADAAPGASKAAGRLTGDVFRAMLALGASADGQATADPSARKGKGALSGLMTAPTLTEEPGADAGLLSAAAFAGAPQTLPVQITPTAPATGGGQSGDATGGRTAQPATTVLKAVLAAETKAVTATTPTETPAAATATGETTLDVATTPPAPAATAKAAEAVAAIQTLARQGGPNLPDVGAVAVSDRRTGEVRAEGDRRSERQTAIKGDAPKVSADAPLAAGASPSPSAGAASPQASAQPAGPDAAAVQTAPVEGGAADLAQTVETDPAAADATLDLPGETARAEIAAQAKAAAQAPTSGLAKATIETTAMLAAGIARRLEGRSTRFELGLTPEGLGKVDVSIEIGDDGQLAARLAFDNPVAAAELRARADELRRQLIDAGFQLAGDALDFSEHQAGGETAGDRWSNDRSAFSGAARLAEVADERAASPWVSLSIAREGVDMKV